MKSAVYLGKENIEIREVPIPRCGDNEVLIENIFSSICGTDVAVFHHGPKTGHRVDIGGEFGHETVSRIAAAGKNVKDFRVGERVYPYPLYAKGDTRRAGTIGGFSEFILIPKPKENHSLYKVDERISSRLACLIEPFTVGCRAARRSEPKAGEKAAVFGCGTIGTAAAVALKHFGLKKVMICDYSPLRLEIARSLGFKVCSMEDDDFGRCAEEYFGCAPSLTGKVPDIDIWIDAAGDESVFDAFMKKGKIMSRFVSVAVSKAERNLDMLHLTYSQKSVIGSSGYMPEDVETVMDIMAGGRWDLERLITHEYSIEELEDAIRTAGDVNSAFNVTIRFGAADEISK